MLIEIDKFLSKRFWLPLHVVLSHIMHWVSEVLSLFRVSLAHPVPLPREGAKTALSEGDWCLCSQSWPFTCLCGPAYLVISLLKMEWILGERRNSIYTRGMLLAKEMCFSAESLTRLQSYRLKDESIWLRNPTPPSQTWLLTDASLASIWSGFMGWP